MMPAITEFLEKGKIIFSIFLLLSDLWITSYMMEKFPYGTWVNFPIYMTGILIGFTLIFYIIHLVVEYLGPKKT